MTTAEESARWDRAYVIYNAIINRCVRDKVFNDFAIIGGTRPGIEASEAMELALAKYGLWEDHNHALSAREYEEVLAAQDAYAAIEEG